MKITPQHAKSRIKSEAAMDAEEVREAKQIAQMGDGEILKTFFEDGVFDLNKPNVLKKLHKVKKFHAVLKDAGLFDSNLI